MDRKRFSTLLVSLRGEGPIRGHTYLTYVLLEQESWSLLLLAESFNIRGWKEKVCDIQIQTLWCVSSDPFLNLVVTFKSILRVKWTVCPQSNTGGDMSSVKWFLLWNIWIYSIITRWRSAIVSLVSLLHVINVRWKPRPTSPLSAFIKVGIILNHKTVDKSTKTFRGRSRTKYYLLICFMTLVINHVVLLLSANEVPGNRSEPDGEPDGEASQSNMWLHVVSTVAGII